MGSILKKMENVGVSQDLSPKEIKRIKVLNITAYVALIHAVFFLYFDYYLDSLDDLKLVTLILEILFFSLVLYFQHRGLAKFSRIIFTFTVYFNLFFHCNYAFKGFYGEYQYLVIPLFSLFFFDKKYIHYGLLLLAIVSFYVPNLYLDIYPEQYFGYLNTLFLFIGIFLIINYFKRTNEKNEQRLSDQLKKNEEMKEVLDQKNKELTALNNFQNHFFVNIAHEMGTPVTLLKGQIGQLAKRTKSKEKTYPEVGKISKQIDKLEHLLYDIIDIAKMDAKKLSLNKLKLSLNQIAQKAYFEFQPLFEQKNIELALNLHPEDIKIKADAIYLERAISNILSNAYKYTESGGKVFISVNATKKDASLSIIDTGIGVPDHDLKTIFERFYQSPNHINQASGSGIGLAFVKEIIELHGGKVLAKANIPAGLEIEIDLPKINEPTKPNTVTKSLDTQLPKQFNLSKRILLVEDNSEMREYLTTILQGYTITEVQNGAEALDLLRENEFDAIITDYMMPVMDGETFVKNLKKQKFRLPVIMITARQDSASKLKILRLGVDDYLNKPFMEEELLLRLKNCIKNYESSKSFSIENKLEVNDKIANKLVKDAKSIIIKNIGNQYFGVAQLSDQLKVSERTLHRNIKKETGLSPNQFIRELKLDHVRNLVEKQEFSSLQALALSVGLSNGTYLNQLYRDRFGIYIKEA